MRFHMNQQTIAGSDNDRLKEPAKCNTRRIETEKQMQAYLNANDFAEDYKQDLIQMFWDEGHIDVEE